MGVVPNPPPPGVLSAGLTKNVYRVKMLHPRNLFKIAFSSEGCRLFICCSRLILSNFTNIKELYKLKTILSSFISHLVFIRQHKFIALWQLPKGITGINRQINLGLRTKFMFREFNIVGAVVTVSLILFCFILTLLKRFLFCLFNRRPIVWHARQFDH